MSNFKSFSAKIKKATNKSDLDKLEKSLTLLYDAGQLTVSEFQRLDIKIIDKSIECTTSQSIPI